MVGVEMVVMVVVGSVRAGVRVGVRVGMGVDAEESDAVVVVVVVVVRGRGCVSLFMFRPGQQGQRGDEDRDEWYQSGTERLEEPPQRKPHGTTEVMLDGGKKLRLERDRLLRRRRPRGRCP